MASSYLRMRCPVEEAMARYGRWIGAPELGPPRLVRERDWIRVMEWVEADEELARTEQGWLWIHRVA
jgi:hypothetical protein